MDKSLTLFLALTKISVGNADSLPCPPTEEEWQFLFNMANKQTIAGPLFAAIDRLPAEQRPPRKVFVDWLATTEKIKHDSREANHNAVWASKKFNQVGFRNVIASPSMSLDVVTSEMWSLSKYKSALDAKDAEKWDELEKSVVAKIADEVKIAIRGSKVEMLVYKDFSA